MGEAMCRRRWEEVVGIDLWLRRSNGYPYCVNDHLCFFYSPCAESIEMSNLVIVNCHVQLNNR